jgi:cellulose synthase/poly-beta-1,6-N-acetylglucosamine synthase-like glycosyltransferase
MVGSNVLNHLPNKTAVAELEQLYISRENKMKYREGLLNGALMGPFGACFSMQAKLFVPLPTHFIVDDFYLCMQVHNQGKKCIYDLNAICYEDVPGNMWEEFRRKSRIGAGNFQNLAFFKNWLLKPFHPVGFTFISHKVLRWLTPFFALAGLISIALLAGHYTFYEELLKYNLLIVGLFALDLLLVFFNIHIKPLRLITYFYFMNFALGLGFIYYVKGIKSNTWKPTQRNIIK